jgi:uncharacterized protein
VLAAGVFHPIFRSARYPRRIRETPLPSPEFSISAHDLDAAGKDFRLPVRAAWIRGALEGTEVGPGLADGEIALRLSKSGPDVVVRGTLRATLSVPCARCLEPATVQVDEELSALAVVQGSARGAKTDEESLDVEPDGADTIGYDGDNLVLDQLLRDELLLAIPMIPLCSEACPGIRPQRADASAGVAVDPRMRPLMSLKKT